MKIVRFPRVRITKDLNQTMTGEHVCPFCGKHASFCDKSHRMFNKTTGNGFDEPYVFHNYTIDVYTCGRCYAIWESEPYEENPFSKPRIRTLVDAIKSALMIEDNVMDGEEDENSKNADIEEL